MLDIEFVSELAIGFLHGLQNKKDNLDDWYKTYETGYERRGEVESMFNTVLFELLAADPEISEFRWKKKSDFYSLFLVLAKHYKSFPLPREGRDKLREALRLFAGQVDGAVGTAEGMTIRKGTELAHKYARAVEKAASDLGSRKVRNTALEEVLAPVLKAG